MQQSQIFSGQKCMLPDWGGRAGIGPGFPGCAYEGDEPITWGG